MMLNKPRPISERLPEILQQSQISTLTNALRVAAERFDEDVKVFEAQKIEVERQLAEKPDAMPFFTPRACDQLAEQFRRQAADTRELLGLVEGWNDDDEGEDDER